MKHYNIKDRYDLAVYQLHSGDLDTIGYFKSICIGSKVHNYLKSNPEVLNTKYACPSVEIPEVGTVIALSYQQDVGMDEIGIVWDVLYRILEESPGYFIAVTPAGEMDYFPISSRLEFNLIADVTPPGMSSLNNQG